MEKKSDPNDTNPNNESVTAKTIPVPKKANISSTRDQLYILWKDLVQKQRVHEMIKCLQAEKQKLKILHNIEPDSDFLEFAAQQHAAKADGSKNQSEPPTGESKDKEGKPKEVGVTESTATVNATVDEGAGKEKGSRSVRRSSELDRVSSSRLDTQQLQKHHNKNAHTKSAVEVLSNKRDLTDQEFEDIVELCEDKIEQKALREAYEEKKSRERYLHNASEARVMLYNFINSKFFVNFMLITIITSIIGIFLLTFESISVRYAWPLIILDSCIIGIFLVEAILKIIIFTEDYFLQLWNLLDMLIIIVHFVELAVDLTTRTLALSTDINSNIGFKFLKSLRALRLLRVIKFLPNLQVIVTTVFQSMLSIGSIAVLMLLFIFVFAVMGRGLFYEWTPDKFGNLWLSFVTLFQLLTLDDWFELMASTGGRPVDEEEFDELEKPDQKGYWLMFGYLFAYLVIEYFVFLNLFVAVLVDNFQLTLADAEIQKQKEAQDELEAQRKFDDMKKEGIDPNITEGEHQNHQSELEQLGMFVEEYFPVNKDSTEAELLSEFYKDLNSLDFERFLWKRRFSLFNIISDAALDSRAQNTSLPNQQFSDSDDDDSINDEIASNTVKSSQDGDDEGLGDDPTSRSRQRSLPSVAETASVSDIRQLSAHKRRMSYSKGIHSMANRTGKTS